MRATPGLVVTAWLPTQGLGVAVNAPAADLGSQDAPAFLAQELFAKQSP